MLLCRPKPAVATAPMGFRRNPVVATVNNAALLAADRPTAVPELTESASLRLNSPASTLVLVARSKRSLGANSRQPAPNSAKAI
ncbi:hypothetical protein D3C84_1172780 [compost metagenome]